MTSSTSSSDGAAVLVRPRARDRARHALLLWIVLMVAATVVGVCVDRSRPLWRAGSVYRAGVPDVSREWYLAADRDGLDYDVLYNGWWNTRGPLRAADVLFVGNSRAVYAFRPEVFQPYLDRVGWRGYNLSFAGGADAFPLAIIRKFDLHPKVVVVSSDGFFVNALSRFESWATERSTWESWRFYHEWIASWTVRRHLHQVFPPWRDYLFTRRYQVWYRSRLTGGMWWVLAEDQRRLLTREAPATPNARDQAVIDELVRTQLPNLLAFRAEMERRGATLVLTLAPYNEVLTYHMTRRLSELSGVPYIDAWPIGLEGQAGSHMNLRSSKVFLGEVMPRLLALPEVRRRLP